MRYAAFIDSLGQPVPPAGADPCLQALWHEANGDWTTTHEIVQVLNGRSAARIHAYLHRKEGEDWNARYWHRQAGTVFPEGMSFGEEWDGLVRGLTD